MAPWKPMTYQEWLEYAAWWEQPGSLYAPEADDDAAEIDGILPLPGLKIEELRRAARPDLSS